MSKNLIIGLASIAVIATCVAAYFYAEDKKNKRKIIDLEHDNMQLILDSIKYNKNLTEEIKNQLIKLVQEFETIDI